jgi:DNA invertase Pin-like site-specific DNA recombinase
MYIRVSTKQQDLYRQEQLGEQLIKKGEVDKIYREKASGKDTNRPVLQELLKFARSGDTIIVESISRLIRSMTDFFKLLQEFKTKGITFKSINEPFVNTDSNNPFSDVMALFMAKMAEIERDLIKERQKAGIERAKKEGKYKGRKKIVPDNGIFETLYKQWKNEKIKAKDFMKALGVKKDTFYRRVKEYEKQNNIMTIQEEKEYFTSLNQKVRKNKLEREKQAI